MKIPVKSLENKKKVGEVDLPDTVFDYPYNEHLVHLVVEAQRAAERAGTHKVKGRGEVAGSGRKPWRQKGTGRARVGSIRSPLWRTGGTTHGPKPRNYEKKVTPREKRNALKSALSERLRLEGFIVVDNLDLGSHKTAELEKLLVDLGIDGKALLVDQFHNDNLALASRNNPRLKAVDALAVNVYDVVDRPHVVISQGALDRLTEVLSQ